MSSTEVTADPSRRAGHVDRTANTSAAARLVRSTGFGGTGSAIDAVASMGTAKYLAMVLAADPAKDIGAVATPMPAFQVFRPLPKSASVTAGIARYRLLAGQVQELTGWWIRRMVAVERPFGEKLTFCWHDHFATSTSKVLNAGWMPAQNQKLRTMGRGIRGPAHGSRSDSRL